LPRLLIVPIVPCALIASVYILAAVGAMENRMARLDTLPLIA